MSGDADKTYVSRGGLKLAAALEAFGLLTGSKDAPLTVRGRRCADLGANVGGFTDCLLQAGAAHVYAVDTAYGELAWTLRQDERVTVVERSNALHFNPQTDLATLGQRKPKRHKPAGLRAGKTTGRRGDANPHKTDPSPTDRSDALRSPAFAGVDLVTVDLGWTPQKRAVPAALQWLRSGLAVSANAQCVEPMDRELDAEPSFNPSLELDPEPIGIITLIKPHYEVDKKTLADQGDRGVLPEAIAMATIERVLSEFPALGVEVAGHVLSPIHGGASRGRKGNIESLAWLRPISR